MAQYVTLQPNPSYTVTVDPWSQAFCSSRETFLNSSINHASRPQLSVCFQDTVLVWVPCILMWIFVPLYLLLLSFENGQEVQDCKISRRSWLNITKLVVGVLLSLLAIVEIILVAVRAEHGGEFRSAMQASIIRLITMVIATALIAWEFRKAVFSSGFLFVFWLVYALCYSVLVYTYATVAEFQTFDKFYPIYIRIRLASYSLILLQLVLSCIRDGTILRIMGHGGNEPRQPMPFEADEQAPLLQRENDIKKDSPARYASYLSKVFFAWAAPIMYRGYRKGINYDELSDVWPTEMIGYLLPWFKSILARDNSQRPNSRKYLYGLLKSVAFLTVKSGLLRLFSIILLFANLLIFRHLIAFIKLRNIPGMRQDAPDWVGYVFACGLLVVTWVRGLVCVRWLYDCDLVGMHLRSLVTATVYRKILRLSNSCVLENMDIGFVVNLMSVDSLRLSMTCRSLHEIATLPIYLLLATLFFYWTIGWAALIGMLVMVTIVPLATTFVAIKNKKLQDLQMDAKDQRLKVMSEILTGIKVIKLYAWELVFERRVTEIRAEELRNIKLSAVLNALGNITCLFIPYIVSLVMFGSYIYLEYDRKTGLPQWLDPGIAFVTLSLICLLNYNVSTLPSSVQYVIQGFIALKRAACLMDQDEVQTDENHLLPVFGGPAVVIENGNFSWIGPQKPILEDINLSIGHGKLVAVVGGVGSGKSSLLSSLLREMKTTTATITISDSVAYLPQQAWILNGTVKDNICFQKPYNHGKFQRVVEACALGPDLEILPGGEMTEIGSKGANLSGGQKQRVSLARAVYSNSDTYLIDDSLSAVDPNVGQHIFKKAFGPRGILRKKTRIFATNSYGFLPEVDRILVLKDGRIVEDGTYEELRLNGPEFCRLISQPQRNEDQKRPTTSSSVKSTTKQLSRRLSALEVLGQAFVKSASHEPDTLNTSFRQSSSNFQHEISLSGDYMTASDIVDEQMIQRDTHRIHVIEDMGSGFIKWHVIWTYIKSAGVGFFVFLMFGELVFIGSQAAANVWLKLWSDTINIKNGTTPDGHTEPYYLEVYGYLGIVQLFAITLNCLLLAFGFLRVSYNLHSNALFRLFRAPISFFDTNPPGRILNYFSTDMDTVDSALPLDIILWLISASFLLGAVVTIGVANPIFLAIIIPIILINAFVNRVYGANAIPLKRFYAVKKSPVYSHFEETIVGAASVRAYRQQQHFIDKCDRLTDESHKPWCTYVGCWRLYACYNEIVGAIAVFLTAVVAVAISDHMKFTAGGIGLALFSIFQVLPHIPIASRMTVEIEANIVAVERIKEYSGEPKVPMEAAWQIEEHEPPPLWPTKGTVKFEDFSTRYREGLEMVLAHLSFQINDQEKVGIVGRTGAGKSSIILSLFRMMEAAGGRIVIDGEDISSMGLHDLRSKLTTIPQDPILFSGTLRSNLDPLRKHSDDQIWKALEQAHLKPYVESQMAQGLDENVSSGDEISVGQRQLLCMARALLRNSKVIILDEATSGIDPLTDELIQKTIREQFKSSTVITIAHRISTIMDYNRVMVLDHGRLMEMGPPHQLLAQKNSLFASMAQETRKTFGDDMPKPNAADNGPIPSATSESDDV